MRRTIHVVVNPAAGRPQPVLYTLNSVFRRFNIRWEISVTQRSGDAQRFARQAARSGVDVVAAYGGDGTVMEVACGLIEAARLGGQPNAGAEPPADDSAPPGSSMPLGTPVPLAILPGGTANLMAVELGIPRDLALAVELAANPNSFARRVDAGRIERPAAGPGGIIHPLPLARQPGSLQGDSSQTEARQRRAGRPRRLQMRPQTRPYFLLRLGVGYAARRVRIADRAMKTRYGLLAYSIAGLLALQRSQPANYRLTLDGLTYEGSGLTCLVDNASNIGIGGIGVGSASISDGLLDVILVRDAGFRSWLGMGAHLLGGANLLGVNSPASESNPLPATPPTDTEQRSESFFHWQARRIRIEAEPAQPVQMDGEMAGRTPLEIETLPHALEVLTPD